MSRPGRPWQCVPAVLLTAICLATAGCTGPSRWDMPAVQIPRQRLRQIDPLDLDATSADAPATAEPSDSTTQPADAPPPAEMALTIGECRALALAGNLSLRAELISPTIAAQSISEEEAAFEAVFKTDASHTKIDSPAGSALTSSKIDTLSVRPSVELPLRTGGQIAVSSPFARADASGGDPTPAFTSDLSASISQPLLRGAGLRTNTHAIRVARLSHQGSEAMAKLEVIRVLAAADRVYWRLYATGEALLVREQEHELAKALLARATRQVEVGTKPEVEIVRAELGVAESIEAIIVAGNELRDRQRELKRLIQKPGLGMDTPTKVVPADVPDVSRYVVDTDRLIDLAVRNRMELIALELEIAADSSAIQLARNSTLPLVSLEYTYNVNGLGPNPGDSYDLMFDKRFEDHQFGLQVEIPIGNQAARSRLRSAMLTRAQSLARHRDRESLIRQEVYDSADQLEANWHRISAARQRVVHAVRVMQAEQRQFDQGLRTSTEVLAAQAALADAKLSEIRALAEYQIAQVDIAVATGMLLGADRVRWTPVTSAEQTGLVSPRARLPAPSWARRTRASTR